MGPVALHDILRTRLWLGAEKEGVAGHYAVFLSRRRNEISAPVVLRPCYDALLCSKNVTHLPLMLVAYFCCCCWGVASAASGEDVRLGDPFDSEDGANGSWGSFHIDGHTVEDKATGECYLARHPDSMYAEDLFESVEAATSNPCVAN
jgi:hypothetical protein